MISGQFDPLILHQAFHKRHLLHFYIKIGDLNKEAAQQIILIKF